MAQQICPPLATTALALTAQEWGRISLNQSDPVTAMSDDMDVIVERVTSLLLVRVVAVVARPGSFHDLSTSTICRTVIMKQKESWPEPVNMQVIAQLAEFVRRILAGYKDVPYHNYQHAYHVVVSMNKLIDLMLTSTSSPGKASGSGSPQKHSQQSGKKKLLSPTFGLRHDPLMLLSLLFSALIHDVEHQGIPNRQLAQEDDRLAVLYNDQSIAEHWSLYVAFSEFLQDEFAELREAIFYNDAAAQKQQQQQSQQQPPGADMNREQYRKFRKTVINLVLCTDIASPERTQIGKSKWKEAFGDPFETVERKLRARRLSLTGKDVQVVASEQHRSNLVQKQRRRGTGESMVSQLSVDAAVEENRATNFDGTDQGEQGEGEEDSLSGTPEHSETEEGDDTGYGYGTQRRGGRGHANKTTVSASSGQSASTSGGGGFDDANGETAMQKFERRLSANSRRYRYRLGILRAVDLSGETLETYSRASIGHSIHSFGSSAAPASVDIDMDEPDELKATVVMEVLMTAADVAHNLQGWDHMCYWSTRLYMELRKAFASARSTTDPEQRWFENQTGFLESYLLPLARRLEDTGVFGNIVGPTFVQTVESNRDKWLTDGYDITQRTVHEGAELYPMMYEDEDN